MIRIVTILALFIGCHCATAQIPYLNVQFDYQNRLETSGFSSTETDSFYIIPTKGASPYSTVADTPFLIRINKFTGQVGFKKLDYYEGFSVINAIPTLNHNRILIQGSKYNAPKETTDVDNDMYMAILNKSTLDTIALKTYGLTNKYDGFFKPIATSDGGFFTSGWDFDLPSTQKQAVVLFKCDSNLHQQFYKLYPPTPGGFYYGGGVLETPDHGFLITGLQESSGGDYRDAMLLKIDSLGNLNWKKMYLHNGDTTNRELASIVRQADGTYLTVGQQIINPLFGPTRESSWVAGIDANGNMLWWKAYAENERSGWEKVVPSNDGNFYACGYERDFADSDLYLQYATISKLSPQGDLIWHRRYTVQPAGKHYDAFYNLISTSDGGILCNGTTYQNDTTRQNAWVVKLDSLGCLTPGCNLHVGVVELPVGDATPFVISPNPNDGHFEIRAKNQQHMQAVRVFDAGGRMVFESKEGNASSVSVSLNHPGAGTYFCSVLMDGVWFVRSVAIGR
jgi:hypothetical protein